MQSTLLRLATAALLGIAASPVFAEDIKITVVGVGDIYAFDGGKVRGGFARLNALAKAEKAANPNTLYVLDGDMFSPSLLSGITKGAQSAHLNLIYTPLPKLDLGAELIWGQRELENGDRGELNRLQTHVTYNF